ncbi:MAG: T9SS type A sorting domain-containing protein [candidate division WOR-3 bacterium]
MRLVFRQGAGWYPRAACCGDTVHLVWWQHYAHDEVFYKRSTDAGNTWGEDVMLSVEDANCSVTPTIGVNRNHVHVVWKEYGLYYYAICYRKSTDGGNTWVAIDTLYKTNMDGIRGEPRLCVCGDTLYLVSIRDDGNVLFNRSTDNGANWDSAIVIGEGAAHPSFKMGKSNGLYLALSVNASGVVEILFYISTNGGVEWSDSQFVSEIDIAGSQRPAMDTDDSGGVHITWYDYKYSPYPWTGDIFYRASRDSGNTWEPIESLTVMHRAVASDILAEGNNLHLVWEDDRNDFGNNFEIYYRMSTDLGRSWGPEERLTNAPYYSRWPSLACGGGYLHLFWQDRREYGNNGPSAPIYYKRKDLSVGIKQEVSGILDSSNLILNCPTILMNNSLIYYRLGKNKNGEINLIDVAGRVVMTVPVHSVSGEFVLEDFNKEVRSGIYFLMLRADNQYVINKVLVVR